MSAPLGFLFGFCIWDGDVLAWLCLLGRWYLMEINA